VSTNDQLKPIRQLDLYSQRNKIDSDTTLSEVEKKAKLADVDQKLASLK
jgi:phosphonate transport system substrate-binding protein